jgi:8-hydroxy-5-deazaflavin:NADPH oxidoreductase
MDIAIIGTGNVGKALGSSLVKAGHSVTFAAKTAEHAADAASDLHARSAASSSEAVAAADLVILAVPATALGAVSQDIGASAAGKVVVDVSNRPTPDPSGAATSIAEELQARLPDSTVVKAFNTAFASRQAEPYFSGVAADGFVAGDDAAAKQTVLDVVESIGFRPVDAGSLAVARTLEGMAWLNINRAMNDGTWQDAWVIVGPDNAVDASRN